MIAVLALIDIACGSVVLVVFSGGVVDDYALANIIFIVALPNQFLGFNLSKYRISSVCVVLPCLQKI